MRRGGAKKSAEGDSYSNAETLTTETLKFEEGIGSKKRQTEKRKRPPQRVNSMPNDQKWNVGSRKGGRTSDCRLINITRRFISNVDCFIGCFGAFWSTTRDI